MLSTSALPGCCPTWHREGTRCMGTTCPMNRPFGSRHIRCCHQHPLACRERGQAAEDHPDPPAKGLVWLWDTLHPDEDILQNTRMLKLPLSDKNTIMWWQMWTELTCSSCSQLLKRLSIAAAAHAPGFAGQRQVQKLPNASFHCAVEAKSWEIFHKLRILKMLFGDKRSTFVFEHCLEKIPLRNPEAKYIVKWKAAPSWKIWSVSLKKVRIRLVWVWGDASSRKKM